MNFQHRYIIAVPCLLHLLLAGALWGQEVAIPHRTGVPQDWSEHSIVFSLDGLAQHPDLIYQEPRVLHQLMRHFYPSASGVLPEAGEEVGSGVLTSHHRDWNVALGKGHIPIGMYPAKYSFDPSAPPSCANDYVVFGLNTAGSTGGQANLVGFNNLYAGTGGFCSSGPSVMFAYNTTTVAGGKIMTSPILSLDGTKIGYVESAGTLSIFHILKWTAGQGTILMAAAPSSVASVTFSNSSTTTTSSPWIDYASDVVYIADDGGILHKITGVFKGTPTLAGSPWPVTVSAGTRLGPPVLDRSRSLLLIGGRNGDLYEVNTTSGAVSALIVGAHGSTYAGILAPPMVDVTNGTTFVISANDGNSAVLVQVDTTLLTTMATGRIGLGAATGNAVFIYQPAFSNAYYTKPSNGTISTCGTGAADSTPWRYSFGFTGRTMVTAPASSGQLLTSTAAGCTSWTEFFNPNVGAGGTDFFFFGLTQDCTGTGTLGCVAEITAASTTLKTAPVSGGPSGIIIDNYSTQGQASSIYLTAEKVNTAYKFTQNGLQ